MQKLILYFIALFVLFFACKQANSEQAATSNNPTNTSTVTKTSEKAPVPTPIPPPQTPTKAPFKQVEQAPAKDLVYPKEFISFGIPQFSGATMENNTKLDNDVGKYGRRIKMNSKASFDEVMDFYAKELVQNGWVKNAKMDRLKEDEGIKFYTTNYEKDEHTLMIAITRLTPNNISILNLLKEN